jgi:hypothetical protein
MLRWTLSSFLVITCSSLVACGGSPPTSPTPSLNGLPDAAAEAAANAMVIEALSQTTAAGATLVSSLPLTPVRIYPCPGGGDITITTTMPTTVDAFQQGVITLTSRTEYNDCRSQNVTTRGAPALVHTSEIRTPGLVPSGPANLTGTMRTTTTGGLSITSNGVESLMRVDCASVMVIELGQPGSMPLPQITWTGTMTWESPAGTVVRTTPCGPPR